MDHSKVLGEESIEKLIVKFSIPAIIGMLVNALYNVVDRIFIGNGVSSLALSGLTVTFPIMLISKKERRSRKNCRKCIYSAHSGLTDLLSSLSFIS